MDDLSVETNRSPDTLPEPVASIPHDDEAESDVAIVETVTAPTLQHLPKAIALPESSDTTAVAILQPIEVEGLQVELRGGEGAYRSGIFSIEPAPADDSWSIVHQDKVAVKLATLVLGGNALRFQWSPSAAECAAARNLGNTVLHLHCAGSTATVALRTPHSFDALPAVLHEGIVRHKIPIEFPPAWTDVFVEFVPRDDSLAAAVKTKVMPAGEGHLWLGLEAGEKSLFFMQVKSRMSKRRSLEFIPHSRLHVGDAPAEIKKGAIHQFESELMIARRTLLGGKSRIKRIKDRKQKVAAQARLRKLEANLKDLAEVAESYDAASMTELHFRVFRRVEGRDVDLCHVGQGHRESGH